MYKKIFEALQEAECFLYYENNKESTPELEAAHEAIKEALMIYSTNLKEKIESEDK